MNHDSRIKHVPISTLWAHASHGVMWVAIVASQKYSCQCTLQSANCYEMQKNELNSSIRTLAKSLTNTVAGDTYTTDQK